MFSIKIKSFLYGVIISAGLVSVMTYANSDGVFGDYFTRMTGLCTNDSVITGFQTSSSIYGTKECTRISDLIGSLNIFHLAGNIGIGTTMPSSRLDVNGKIQSETTVISDSDRTVTTKSYVDNGLKGVCVSMGGTWSDLFKICSPGYIYTWQISGYGACSVSCGPGTQTATIYCKRNDGSIEPDNKCAGTKPSASQSCNLGACPPPPPPPPVIPTTPTPTTPTPTTPTPTTVALYWPNTTYALNVGLTTITCGDTSMGQSPSGIPCNAGETKDIGWSCTSAAHLPNYFVSTYDRTGQVCFGSISDGSAKYCTCSAR